MNSWKCFAGLRKVKALAQRNPAFENSFILFPRLNPFRFRSRLNAVGE